LAVRRTQPEPGFASHWIAGAGSPATTTEKDAVVAAGRMTVAAVGWVVIDGAVWADAPAVTAQATTKGNDRRNQDIRPAARDCGAGLALDAFME
jgi:hypothetical protein